jgi:Predicted membrane protein
MILMALDHTRDYFSILRFQPEDLSRSTPLLFATRWVTHFCAPTFFLLAGVGAGLAISGGKSTKEVSRFLFTRGLWLVFLEITVSALGWNFRLGFPLILLVIWALGLSMVILSGLVFLPKKAIAAIALITIAGHNLLDGVGKVSMSGGTALWHILPPARTCPGESLIIVGYPIIPWFAVMALGFVLADVFRWEPARRKKFLLQTGSAAIVTFIVIRFINAYGNPVPWSAQRTAALTVASFLNALKYPPSLDYLLMTLGPTLIALALLENARGSFARAVSVYGRVPMFYYLGHIYVIHILASILALWQGGDASFLSLDTASFPKWYGTTLPGVYLAWALVVLIMYVPCRWFADFKSRRRDWWLSYI